MAVPPPAEPPNPIRATELARSLEAVRERLRAACAAAGRAVGSVTLIAVTKTFPADDVEILLQLGVVDLGESRDQEARAKIADLEGRPLVDNARWHVVGRLQTNKARSVVSYAHAVHSVDRVELATALATQIRRRPRPAPLEVFVQVSLDGDATRGGATPGDVPGVADAVAADPGLRLAGLMAVAPRGPDAGAAFARLAEQSERLRRLYPDAVGISAGMSGDLEEAVSHGATHVRIGSALLGHRDELVG